MILTDEEFDKVIYERLKSRFDHIVNATIGILLIDASIDRNREIFFNYINDYNHNSGHRIDFFIPGFKLKNPFQRNGKWNDHYGLSTDFNEYLIDMDDYIFSQKVYQKAISAIGNMIRDTNILHRTTRPKLVLLDVTLNTEGGQKELKYNEFSIVEIDAINSDALMIIFEEIYKLAAKGYSANQINRKRGLVRIKNAEMLGFIKIFNIFMQDHPVILGVTTSLISAGVVNLINNIH